MYHYVRKFLASTPYFKYLDASDFGKQLEFFQKNGGIIKKQELENWLNGESGYDEKYLLTFDDGIIDHYSNVMPALEKIDAAAIFFISTLPLKKEDFLKVHKLHLIFGSVSVSDITDWLKKNKPACFKLLFDNQGYNPYTSQTGTDMERVIKAFFNWSPYERSEEVVSDLFKDIFGKKLLSGDFYMSREHIVDLWKRGYRVGAHGDRHLVLSHYSKDDQIIEIQTSLSYLSEVIGSDVRLYGVAHGLPNSFNSNTFQIFEDLNVLQNFNVRSESVAKVTRENRYDLPRFNCNEFPYGGVSGDSPPSSNAL